MVLFKTSPGPFFTKSMRFLSSHGIKNTKEIIFKIKKVNRKPIEYLVLFLWGVGEVMGYFEL